MPDRKQRGFSALACVDLEPSTLTIEDRRFFNGEEVLQRRDLLVRLHKLNSFMPMFANFYSVFFIVSTEYPVRFMSSHPHPSPFWHPMISHTVTLLEPKPPLFFEKGARCLRWYSLADVLAGDSLNRTIPPPSSVSSAYMRVVHIQPSTPS